MKKTLTLFNSTWFFWMLATSLGLGISFIVLSILRLNSDMYYILYLIELSILGLFASVGQWMVLRNRSRNAWLWTWIPATTLGFTLGYVFPDLLRFVFPFDTVLLLPISTGLFVGLFQWLAMDKNLRGGIRWILVSIVSWGLGFVLLLPALLIVLKDFYLGAATGLMVGAISGLFVDSVLLKSQKIDRLSSEGEAS